MADVAPRPQARRVLVVGTDDWAIEQAAEVLTGAGHAVLRCHDAGAPAFPCNALREGGVCPLDVGFDLVLDMRTRPAPVPTVEELGVVCALHQHIPLVVGGLVHANPFEPWAAGVVAPNDDLPTAVERVTRAAPIDLRTS